MKSTFCVPEKNSTSAEICLQFQSRWDQKRPQDKEVATREPKNAVNIDQQTQADALLQAAFAKNAR
jgi:hypothetical protein